MSGRIRKGIYQEGKRRAEQVAIYKVLKVGKEV